MTDPPLALLIPAYNPAPVLPGLVRAILDAAPGLFRGALVVDDGSGEQWRGIFEQVAQVPGALVLRRPVNGGKGAALKAGFADLWQRWPELEAVVTADADGQHASEDVARVARALAAAPRQLVLGVRQFDPSVPLRSRVGNKITRGLFRLLTGVRVTDTQTGLRGWPREVARRSQAAKGDGFDFELEALLGSLDIPIVEVPIETIYLDANRTSHFKPVRDSIRVYRVLFAHLFRR